jgi:PAS domain-containing protein
MRSVSPRGGLSAAPPHKTELRGDGVPLERPGVVAGVRSPPARRAPRAGRQRRSFHAQIVGRDGALVAMWPGNTPYRVTHFVSSGALDAVPRWAGEPPMKWMAAGAEARGRRPVDWQDVVMALEHGVIVLDDQTRIVVCHGAAEQLLDRRAGELLGRRPSERPGAAGRGWLAVAVGRAAVGNGAAPRRGPARRSRRTPARWADRPLPARALAGPG